MPTLIQVRDESIEKLLRRFKARGGIVNCFVFRCDKDESEIERHRAVAGESLRLLIKRRHQESVDNVEASYETAAKELTKTVGRQRDKRNLPQIDYRKLAEQQRPIAVLNESINESILNQDVPQKVSAEDFIGPGATYQRAFFDTPDPSLHDLPSGEKDFQPEELEALKDRKECGGIFFLHALPRDKIIFAALNDRLFGETDRLTVYQWGTKCSDYFLEEDDYLWGNYFWTVYSPTFDWYVGILAAAFID